MTPTQEAVLAALAVVAAAVLAAIVGRQTAREANEINRFDAIVDALDVRITSLEHELSNVKTSLVDEQKNHGKTREKLRIALRYIRGVRRDRPELPPVPPELAGDL